MQESYVHDMVDGQLSTPSHKKHMRKGYLLFFPRRSMVGVLLSILYKDCDRIEHGPSLSHQTKSSKQLKIKMSS